MVPYIVKTKINLDRIDGCLAGITSEEQERKVAFDILCSMLRVPYYDFSIRDEHNMFCVNENEVLAYLYRKCGLNSQYIEEEKGIGYVKVYLGSNAKIVDFFLTRNLHLYGLQSPNVNNFAKSLGERQEWKIQLEKMDDYK